MNEEIVKNWVTVPKKNVDEALSWAKQFNDYITNDYAVIGGRIEHYQQGNDYDNFDFFFEPKSKVLKEFVELFGYKRMKNKNVNERIQELALQAGYEKDNFGVGHWDMPECKKFVKLIIREYSYDVMDLTSAPDHVAFAAKQWGVEL